MTSEEMYNINRANGDTEMVKDFRAYLGSVISSNSDCSQEIKRWLRLRRAAPEEVGTITKSEDVSSETKAKIILTFVFSITTYGIEVDSEGGWQEKSWFIWNMKLGESSMDTLTRRKTNICVPEQMKPDIPAGDKKWQNGRGPTSATAWEGRVVWKRQEFWEKQEAAGKEEDQIWVGLTL